MDTVDPVDYPLCSASASAFKFSERPLCLCRAGGSQSTPVLAIWQKKPCMVGAGRQYLGNLQGSGRGLQG